MSKRKVIFPGTFDPFTLGHSDILYRLLALFDTVYIAVAVNTGKEPVFSISERKCMIQKVVADEPNIHVVAFSGLVTEFMKSNDIKILARGIRDSEDLLHESKMSRMNKILYPEMETVFLHTAEGYAYISASLIKEIVRFDGPLDGLVPKAIVNIVKEKLYLRDKNQPETPSEY